MGRHAGEWKLRWKAGWARIRFTFNGQPWDIALGTKDAREAAEAAPREYAKVVSGRRTKRARRTVKQGRGLELLIAEWIETREGGWHPSFADTVRGYGNTWHKYFGELDEVTTESGRAFGYARLTRALRKTVLRELSYLRLFLFWCYEEGHVGEAIAVPPLPKKKTGVRTGKQRRKSVHISKEDAMKILPLLPRESKTIKGKRWPVRDRYTVAWETGLRPATLAALSVPEHYVKGDKVLLITDEIDKARFGRELDLTPRARQALDRCAPDKGLIFGKHKFYKTLKKAATAVLGERLGKDFADYDFRHGMANHMLDENPNIRGVAYVLGHTQMSTTDKYLKADRKQAKKALGVG